MDRFPQLVQANTTINVTIDIIDDSIWEGEESFEVSIVDASPDNTVTCRINTTVIQILDDDRKHMFNQRSLV